MSESATSTLKSEAGTLLTYASLRFLGDALQPDRISDILGVQPTLAYRKGEIFKRSQGRDLRGRTGLWLVRSKGQVGSAELRTHLDYLVGILYPPGGDDLVRPLRAVMREDGLEAGVSCFWRGEHGATPPEIPEAIRAAFARLPAAIETDFDTD